MPFVLIAKKYVHTVYVLLIAFIVIDLSLSFF